MNFQTRLWQAHETGGNYGKAAAAQNKTLSMHRWANWIAGFSGEFASKAIAQSLRRETSARTNSDERNRVVLDPFAGVGTTLLEAKRAGLESIGFEINPFAALVCRVKLEASDISLDDLKASLKNYRDFMGGGSGSQSEPFSSPPSGFRSRIPFFSPAVERKVLFSLDFIEKLPSQIKDFFRVAFASVMVDFSNYSYEPSLGTRPGAGKPLVYDADVADILSQKLRDMIADITELQGRSNSQLPESQGNCPIPHWRIYERSFFDAGSFIEDDSIDLIVTSPPYLNNYHYVRNSRPQLFWTGLVHSTSELKALEMENFGKFWQTVRGAKAITLTPQLPRLDELIEEIRKINCDRGVYGGNGWANYVATYMNDLDRFCGLVRKVLKPGGTAVVVVGNSIVQGKELRVEEYLSDIAQNHGLTTLNIVKLRERVGTSIVNSGARLQSKNKPALYDAAVAIHRNG